MGKYCQDEQLQCNKGTTRKLEPGILKRWTLKYLNMAVRSKQCSKTKNYKDDLPFVCVISIFSIFVENYELKELFLLETSLLSKYQQANIHILSNLHPIPTLSIQVNYHEKSDVCSITGT